ncbi:MAG: STN and carboxypeptidase regulatory-like domain-containing protein, partial [Bacteroidia bacterium]
AGMFNAVGGDVEGVQLAGIVNYDKKNLKGFQAGGILNNVAGTVEAVQLAGVLNYDQRGMRGFQAAGVANTVFGTVQGVQVAGVSNFAVKKSSGMQISGVGNISAAEFRGTQIAGVFNYAKKFSGLQVGLINLADTSLGTSIGLLNLSKNGYKKISFFSNDLVNANAAIKTGNANLYTLLVAGKNFSDTARIETIGVGFGHDFVFGKRIAIEGEMITQYLYLGNFDYANILMRFQANLELRLFKGFAVFGGPSYAYYNSNAPMGASAKGYKQNIVPTKHHSFSGNNKGWWGWNVGVTLF